MVGRPDRQHLGRHRYGLERLALVQRRQLSLDDLVRPRRIARPARAGKITSCQAPFRVPGTFWRPGTIGPQVMGGIGVNVDLTATIDPLTGASMPEGRHKAFRLYGPVTNAAFRPSQPAEGAVLLRPARESMGYAGRQPHVGVRVLGLIGDRTADRLQGRRKPSDPRPAAAARSERGHSREMGTRGAASGSRR